MKQIRKEKTLFLSFSTREWYNQKAGATFPGLTTGRPDKRMDYDVLIIGAGPGGIFTAYELTEKAEKPLKVAVFELGR